MKKLLSLLLAAALTSAAFAADSVPLFNATLSMGKEHRFVLVSAAGKSSSFLRLGEVFEGYALKAYDAKTGELTLTKDGKEMKVTLVSDAAITNANVAPGRATVADAKALLDSMNFEQMMDRTLDAVRKQQSAMVTQMTGRMLPPNADAETREAVANFQKKMMDTLMSGLNGAEMKEDMAKMYSEVFSKDELQALGSFYQSPIGKVFSDKQPELAEKMNAVMAPRMMAAMPKVQQMQQEFQQEMRARRAAAGGQPATTPSPTPAPKN
jgi:hypothetical protein